MFPLVNYRHRMAWIRILAVSACILGSASSQNFSLLVTDSNPLGIGDFVPGGLDLGMPGLGGTGMESGIKGGFGYGAGLESVYDSNFGLTEDNEQSEVSLLFSPWLQYFSDPEGGARVSLTASYTPIFRAYQHNSDLNDVDQTGDVTLNFVGGKTEISLFARYNELSATDRLTGNFVAGSLLTGGVRATRQIGPRTTLNAGLSMAESDFGSSGEEGSQVLTANFGGIWEITTRTGLGSSVRYTQTESDNTGTREAWALLAELRYRMGERIWLSASLGPEFAKDSETDETSVGLAGDLSARYVINERWTWVTTARTATVPSPSDAGYLVNNTLLRSGLEHQRNRSSISGGFEFNYSDYEKVGAVPDRDNEKNLSLYLGYARNLFKERVAFNSRVNYTLNKGETDWNQLQLTLGLNVAF
ncbi:MAG: hypothetical protein Q8Q59_12505 [Luteolibacter sp.]|jgi:hypothetical protein|nr:hypothetical protein [Luteolibacter sp.]